jgi:rod shape-determining protein MreD
MTPGFVHRMDSWARHMMPAVTTLILALLNVIPLGLPALSDVMPVITVMAVFYWSVYRPDLLPPVAVFLLGLAQDILLGNPTGLTALTLLAVHGVTLTQRQVFLGKPFFFAWLGFTVISAGGFVLMWILTCILATELLLSPAVIFQFLMTAACFPIGAWVFVRVHRYLVR